jgi:hypothetical protein
MISVLLVHTNGAQFSLRFPEGKTFTLSPGPPGRYTVFGDNDVRLADVPQDCTLYIGTVEMQFGQPVGGGNANVE